MDTKLERVKRQLEAISEWRKERDADICKRRKAGETLQAIADRYAMTRERVRQIEAKASLQT